MKLGIGIWNLQIRYFWCPIEADIFPYIRLLQIFLWPKIYARICPCPLRWCRNGVEPKYRKTRHCTAEVQWRVFSWMSYLSFQQFSRWASVVQRAGYIWSASPCCKPPHRKSAYRAVPWWSPLPSLVVRQFQLLQPKDNHRRQWRWKGKQWRGYRLLLQAPDCSSSSCEGASHPCDINGIEVDRILALFKMDNILVH